ncbi:serine hydrolase domain-containing protein [Pacificibacter marinus]|uniref:serine hydrolase domain-containing protein n=1 Tax=Pacificibacter marinus TaxID=658057 RepID=UPI001C06B219|nr:serine hydrolase [Pacificibacter marinus]MBU2868366.1 serine hydrolase [Pacificibacter marinus]
MLFKSLCLIGALVAAVVVMSALPRVSDPSPDYQTEVSHMDAHVSDINAVWPGPDAGDRTRARVVMKGEQIIFEDGPTSQPMNIHSIRKSLLSLAYGIAVDQGLIDLEKTLAELGIDENTALTEQEKTATVRDLLMSRSGIYLPAAGEHDSQITDRPARESHAPGDYFFSNNFDANALGTIFVQETEFEIGAFMEEFLAKPLGLQDFDAGNVIMGDPWFWPSKDTQHLQYYIYMSARDLARIGAMVAQGGLWNGRQIVPHDWITLTTTPHSDLADSHVPYPRYSGVGYQWWVQEETGTVWADGFGEHFLMIDPAHDLVLVERNFTGNALLSTVRWMLSHNKFSGSLGGLMAAHAMLVQKLDG